MINSKTPNNVSPLGLALEDSLDTDRAGEFDIIRICRCQHCRFKGAAFGGNAKVYHSLTVSVRLASDDNANPPDLKPNFPKQDTQGDNLPATNVDVPGVTTRSILEGSELFYLSALAIMLGFGKDPKSLCEFLISDRYWDAI